MNWTIKTLEGEMEVGDATIWVEYSGHCGTSAQQILAEAIEWFLEGGMCDVDVRCESR